MSGTTSESLEQTIASGMARQIVDEVLGARYKEAGTSPYQYPLTANSWELQGTGRERFDDTDDFNGFRAQPAEDLWGLELGQGDVAAKKKGFEAQFRR